MQEKLIIILHEKDLSHPSWAVVNREGFIRQSATHDSAEGLLQIAEDKEVVVLVPGEDVFLTTVSLPKMSRSRLLQALPFALEDQLIEDVDQLHFVSADFQTNGHLPVAIVAKEKMQLWLNLLQSWTIQPDVIMPVTFALPFIDENKWIISINEMAIVRSHFLQGFACDKDILAEMINAALLASEKAPEEIHILNYTEEAYAEKLDVPAHIKEDFINQAQFIADIGKNALKTPSINLLQGKFGNKKAKFTNKIKLWKVTAVLTIAFVFSLFFFPSISYFILKQRVNDIDGEIAVIYKRNFPQANSIVAPKLRMQEKLQKLNSQIGDNRVLILVGYIAKAMLETQNIHIKRFDFQNNQLTLELTAASSEDFSAFTEFLQRRGLNVKQQNANLAGTRVNATLSIE